MSKSDDVGVKSGYVPSSLPSRAYVTAPYFYSK